MDKLEEARELLHQKDGKKALEKLYEILEKDETNAEAWFLAMQCFQFFVPLEKLEASQELTCARYAILYTPEEKKPQRLSSTYHFLFSKILGVLKEDSKVLADGRELLSFYQREAYFDSVGAARKTYERDAPTLEAVRHTLAYCQELFDFIPGSIIQENEDFQQKARKVAALWQKTWGYLTMRLGLYRMAPTQEEVKSALRAYAHFLENVEGGKEILKEPVPFNTLGLDQMEFWEGP